MIRAAAIAVLTVFATVFAAPPSSTMYSNYTVQQEVAISIDDTIGATDSLTIVSNASFGAGDGKQYAIMYAAPTGGGTDSLKVQFVLDANNSSGSFVFRTVIDSMQTTGDIIDLSTIPAPSYTLKIKGYTGNGGEVIIPKMYLISRKIVK